MHPLQGGIAVITGAASGLGLQACHVAAGLKMRIVMADVQSDALEAARRDLANTGTDVRAMTVDVSQASAVEALAHATVQGFGTPHLVFNNAGVAAGGLIWEHSSDDWDWVLGVNLMGVVHGVRVFTPLMLAAARADPGWRGHIVNTASMAGLVNAPNMGVYNVSKHAVVALSETLYQDLALVSEQVHAHVLCPFFVPTDIHRSERNRPQPTGAAPAPTPSQRIAQAMSAQAVGKGKVSAAAVAQAVFDAVAQQRFYIYSHPQALESVRGRLDTLVAGDNPPDPFAARPEIGEHLRRALRDA